MDQFEYYSMGYQKEFSNISLWECLFGKFEYPAMTWEEVSDAIIKARRSRAIYLIKSQPFFYSLGHPFTQSLRG